MPRSPRSDVAPGIFHLIARGNRGERTFLERGDFERFLAILADVVTRERWLLYAYCLMPNHFHLLVETRSPTLSRGMHRLNGTYAQWFNRRHDFDGHLFGDRFYSKPVATPLHLVGSARYIVLNPKRAGLTTGPGRWEWSSYRATLGTVAAPDFLAASELLAQFGRTTDEARRAFRRFVLEAPERLAA